ncbi:type II secretion system protein [Thalassoroseus pseudoceratinae]|uniref:type II secretion system protein n=1 Tax=Thalassoroseus pseudoceratinae TaxID=2713176 RepID=UPI0014210127|nr:prepilin-type N-terminal cleavage/methylation domain-containing protein [Thalassoroseus pseudoceratinae]
MTYTRENVTKQKRGFTLVELVVVVLVMGIVAAVAAPKMFDTAKDARISSTSQSLGVIRDAIDMHLGATGTYPGQDGEEATFLSDLEPFLRGPFPKNHITGAAGDASVTIVSDGTPLSAGGAGDWKYDKSTGEIIINTASFDNL